MSRGNPTFTFRWTKEIRAELERISAEKGVALGDLVRQILKDFISQNKSA